MEICFLFSILLPARRPLMADCWMNGKCRLMCKDDEENVLRCSNRKRCCILSRYLTMDPVTIDGPFPWTTPKLTRKPKAPKPRPGHRIGR
ncbi:beta-defensin 119 [Myotis lucifugus]|uniref:beta-defensin 119 n=1 Tax=Myotis lucifugus TaxID=59463 RepID=UPI000CCBEDD0|nr:beta-defensin 119 [Myotis lucifugus]